MPHPTHTTLRVSPAVAEGLAILAAHEERTVSALVRRMLLHGGRGLDARLCVLAVDESAPMALRERASVAALAVEKEVAGG